VSENPIHIKALDHVVLRVADLDRALTFYRDTLGCEIERSIRELGLVQLRAGAALIDLVPLDSALGRKLGAGPAKQRRNMDHFALELDNFDADLIGAYLEARKVDVGEVGDRYGAQGSGPSIYIQDPDGNTVELKGPARPGTLLRA
tara:strand:+ start:1051 stop:1488 length:438 start_codon:yes stop_codon:yes gene_type:complete